MKNIVIIGGGAAGMFAAINAARLSNGNAKIILLEKSSSLLSKVKVSGGGRCNVTHQCFEVNDLVKNYPRGEKELKGPFHFFNPKNTIEWFEERGVKLKAEADGRMFPITDSSQTIMDCLLKEAKKFGVAIKTNYSVNAISKTENGFEMENQWHEKIVAEKLLIATGGNSQGIILQQLKNWQHTIQPLIPSLFTFLIPLPEIVDLSGISIPLVEIILPKNNFKMKGALLFTHWGLSGPAVLKTSAFAAKQLFESGYKFLVQINFVPQFSAAQVKEILQQQTQNASRQKVYSHVLFDLPKRVWQMLVLKSDINDKQNWADINKLQKEKLLKCLTALDLQTVGKSTFKEEFVTCGGITLSEINFKTMESKLVKNLFFAGEIIDVDGITGGFNFQNAWTTGMMAAHGMM